VILDDALYLLKDLCGLVGPLGLRLNKFKVKGFKALMISLHGIKFVWFAIPKQGI
jgi:hypothetical protein